MRTPYPFPARTCPNRAWHDTVKRACPMCGTSGPAYRTGQRLAATREAILNLALDAGLA